MLRPPSSPDPSRPASAFTLIEVCVVIFILLIMMGMALPSLSSVLAERRLHASLDAVGDLVVEAQRRSVREGKTYLLVWDAGRRVRLLAENLTPKQRRAVEPSALPATGQYRVSLPTDGRPRRGDKDAAAAAEWAFWPTGNCEPATVRFEGAAGVWEATFNPLTAHAKMSVFQPR